jgi:electron transfer flavoprotein beta subunit
VPETEVMVLAVGSERCEEALRAALALGCDRAVLVETTENLDVISVSNLIAQIARREQVDLIFCGGQQADWDSQGMGPAVAERLNWPQVTWTTAFEVHDKQVSGKHDVDDGSELFTATLPIVVTTQQGLNEPRYPTLPNIMKAKKKELKREALENFGITPKLKLLREEVQVKERLRKVLDGKDAQGAAENLVDLLRDEARVLA